MSVDDMFDEPTSTLKGHHMSVASLIFEVESVTKKASLLFLKGDHGTVEDGYMLCHWFENKNIL